MSVSVEGHLPGRVAAIGAAMLRQWWFPPEELVEYGAGTINAVGEGHLCGGETEGQFADRISAAITKANGRPCKVWVSAAYLKPGFWKGLSRTHRRGTLVLLACLLLGLWPPRCPAEPIAVVVTNVERVAVEVTNVSYTAVTTWRTNRTVVLAFKDATRVVTSVVDRLEPAAPARRPMAGPEAIGHRKRPTMANPTDRDVRQAEQPGRHGFLSMDDLHGNSGRRSFGSTAPLVAY